MTLGPFVRRLFGPFEHKISDAYRGIYIDLDAWMAQVGTWVPDARRILEVGCGEGAMTERMVRQYPQATITAIDVSPRLGRLFRGDATRVNFRHVRVEEIAAEEPGGFDLVVLSDVLHHVPTQSRLSLLNAIKVTLATNGCFVFKEWARSNTPIHWMCAASDRYLTGDAVSYLSSDEARTLLRSIFGHAAVGSEAYVPPWRNNLALLVQP